MTELFTNLELRIYWLKITNLFTDLHLVTYWFIY